MAIADNVYGIFGDNRLSGSIRILIVGPQLMDKGLQYEHIG
jgi:hypothetical protein